jgi:hypothetical protein
MRGFGGMVLISFPVKEDALDFLKNKTTLAESLGGGVTGKLFGNDGTRIDSEDKKRNWNHR